MFLVYLTIINISINGFHIGFDSGLLESMRSVYQNAYLSITVSFVSATVFSLLGGIFNNFVGRKKIMLVALVIDYFGISILFYDHSLFLLARVFQGSSFGLYASVSSIYISELSNQEMKGITSVLFTSMLLLGQFISILMNLVFSGWQTPFYNYLLLMKMIILVIQILTAIAMIESPLRREESTIDDVRNCLLKELSFSDSEAAEVILSIETSARLKRQSITRLVKESHILKCLMIACCLQAFQQLSAINAVMYYSPKILLRLDLMRGDMSEKTFNYMLITIINGVKFFIGVLGAFLVRKLNKKKLLIVSHCCVGLALLVLAIGLQLTEKYHDEAQTEKSEELKNHYLYLSKVFGWQVIFGLFIFLLAFTPTIAHLAWIINAEIFPCWGKEIGFSISVSVNWITNTIVTSTFLASPDYIPYFGLFHIYAIMQFAASILSSFIVYDPTTSAI